MCFFMIMDRWSKSQLPTPSVDYEYEAIVPGFVYNKNKKFILLLRVQL